MSAKFRERAPFLLFFGSGLCALVYETVWVRQLVFSFGITIHAISAVLAAYMLGLSLGAAWIARRVRTIADPLRWYAGFEAAIATWAIGLHFVLADVLPQFVHGLHGALGSSTAAIHAARFLVAFALLLVPTTLMGATLPLLGQLVVREEGGRGATLGARIGRLYGLNTLGAVAGTALAGFWMLEKLGILETTLVAAGVNLVVAGVAFRLSGGVAAARAAVVPPPSASILRPDPRDSADRAAVRRLVGGVALLTGFAALSYEVLWNRTLLLYVHNSTYAFSTILAVFLLGVALGSLVYARHAKRFTSVRALGVVQLLLALSAWTSIEVTGRLPSLLARVTAVVGTNSWSAALVDVVAATALVVLVPTFLMGFGFPLAAALYAPEEAEFGAGLGGLYSLNTVGNILGSLVTGFVLIEAVGLRNSFAVGVGCNALAGNVCVFWRSGSLRRVALGTGLTAASVALFLLVVPSDVFRRDFERVASAKVLYYKEEATDTVMVVEGKGGQRTIRYGDGRGTAGTQTELANRLYGHIPMVLHRDPQSVLSICFGVGNTLSALAQWEPRRLLAVELSPGVLQTADYFWTNRHVLGTKHLEVRIDDGRNFLLTSDERFDVIQLEPPEIHTAGVVDLYTREFYELARHDLNEHGLVAQWLNVVLMPEREMKMLVRTMQDVFPYTSLWAGAAWWDVVLVGSTEPIRVDVANLDARLSRPTIRAEFERLGLRGADDVLAHHLLSPESLRRYVGSVPLVTDDLTSVDFTVPKSAAAGFGLFLYQTQQRVPKAKDPERVRQRLTMLAERESPAYLLDFGAGESGGSTDSRGSHNFDEAERARRIAALEAEVARQRRESREEIGRE